jgi:hypothetical protein
MGKSKTRQITLDRNPGLLMEGVGQCILGEKCPILVVKLGVRADRTDRTLECNCGTALLFGL